MPIGPVDPPSLSPSRWGDPNPLAPALVPLQQVLAWAQQLQNLINTQKPLNTDEAAALGEKICDQIIAGFGKYSDPVFQQKAALLKSKSLNWSFINFNVAMGDTSPDTIAKYSGGLNDIMGQVQSFISYIESK